MKLERRNSMEFGAIEVLDFNLKEPLNAVLIIGNGFDKSLNLKTGYMDFIKDNTFTELIKDNNKFAKYLLAKTNLNNWIDIELELASYSNSFSRSNLNFQNEFNELSNQLKLYLKSIDLTTIDEKSEAFKLLNEVSKGKSLILDFNYTDSVSHILKNIKHDKCLVKHIKIHGTIKDDNIIFGVDDKADLIPQHIFLKKSVHKNYSAINFSKYLSESNSIQVFGHSLGETDHMYFSDFFGKSILESNSMCQAKKFLYIIMENKED